MYKLHMYDMIYMYMIYMYLTTKKLGTINLRERDKGICLGRVGGRQGKVKKM